MFALSDNGRKFQERDLGKITFNTNWASQHPIKDQANKLYLSILFIFAVPPSRTCQSSMADRSENLRLLALVEEIKTAIVNNDVSNAATRPGVLRKITDLRDAVEAPQDSLLRIYGQVSH